jgi:hypothetical protein
VDLGCPGNPVTFKPGWIHWKIAGGCDGKPHDGRALNDIAGMGIDAYICLPGDSGGGNLRAGWGDPICNTNYQCQSHKHGSPDGPGLIVGEYWLRTYHDYPKRGPMPSIKVKGPGVIQLEDVTDVPIQDVRSDDELVPSLAKFYTDGSAVLVVYEAPQDYWDYRDYSGGRAACWTFAFSYNPVL